MSIEALQKTAQEALENYSVLPQRYGTAFHVAPPWKTVADIPLELFQVNLEKQLKPEITEDLLPIQAQDTYLNWHLSHVDQLGLDVINVPAGQTLQLNWEAQATHSSQVIKITLGEGATLELHDIAQGQTAWLRRLVVIQEAGSTLNYWGLRSRQVFANEKLQVYLNGPEAQTTITQLEVGQAKNQADVLTTVTHAAPHTHSRMTLRAAGFDTSQTIFRGLITIEPNGGGAVGYQQGRALLLDQAIVDMLPELAINTNDVRCSHGVTTLHLDDAALFYLRSRGLPKEAAEQLAIRGFFHQGLTIPETMAETLESHLAKP